MFHSSGITLALGPDPAAAVAHGVVVAREAGATVSFDLNFRRALWTEAAAQPALTAAVRQADVVFAGVQEAAIVTGTTDPLDAALALEALGPRQVLIKLGAAGCLARIDGVTHDLPAPVVAVLDTVGAGDAFAAGYLAELIAGAAPEQRLATAVAAGAWAVTVSGDWEGMPDRAGARAVRRQRAGRPLGAGVPRRLDRAAVALDHQLGEVLERGLVHLLVDRDAATLHHVDTVAQLEEVGVVVVDHND